MKLSYKIVMDIDLDGANVDKDILLKLCEEGIFKNMESSVLFDNDKYDVAAFINKIFITEINVEDITK